MDTSPARPPSGFPRFLTIAKAVASAILLTIILAIGFLEYRLRQLTEAADACAAHTTVSSYAEDIVVRLIGRQPKRVHSILRHFLRYPVGVNAGGKTVTPALLTQIARQPTIRALTFSRSPGFGDTQLARLTALPLLDTLIIHHTDVTDASAPTFEQLTALQRIELDGCQVSDPTVAALATLHQINHLGLEQTAITPQSLPLLSSFPSLTYLDLKNTATDDTVATAITPLRSLVYLDLENTRVTRALTTSFPPLPLLRTLILRGTKIPRSTTPALMAKLPSIKNLDLP